MRRFYSTFPGGIPGLGLLLLRLWQGLSSMVYGSVGLWELGVAATAAAHGFETVTGLLVLIGLWTPVACLLQALIEIYFVLAGSGQSDLHIARAVLVISLAMLGPGEFSIDARLFGRRRIDINEFRE